MTEAAMTQQFLAALEALERERNLEPMVDVFAADSEIGNIVSLRRFSGPDGARAFWTAYRDTFDVVESSFRNVIVGDGRAALEWTTTGTSADGAPFRYDGVSILEFTDTEITRFWAYFDPGDLGWQIE